MRAFVDCWSLPSIMNCRIAYYDKLADLLQHKFSDVVCWREQVACMSAS